MGWDMRWDEFLGCHLLGLHGPDGWQPAEWIGTHEGIGTHRGGRLAAGEESQWIVSVGWVHSNSAMSLPFERPEPVESWEAEHRC